MPAGENRDEGPERDGPTTLLITDGGDGWLKTFLTAELALYLDRRPGRTLVCEEGELYPTVSGHLHRGRPHRPDGTGPSIQSGPPEGILRPTPARILLEAPHTLPGWARKWLPRAHLALVVVPAGFTGRIRAFHQVRRILRIRKTLPTGIVGAEPPGSGLARQTFHRFQTQLAGEGECLLFLGALPLDPILERSLLPEHRPALLWRPESTLAVAVTKIGAACLRAMTPAAIGEGGGEA